ncbi:MAG: hypothetical protein JWR77_2452 [Rhizorhabdus sp.]|nr:hypothetical protein [Rhizorhabdus sp.]
MSAIDDAAAVAERAIPQARLAGLAVRGVLALIAVALIGFAIWWIFIHPAALKQQAAQGKADTAIQSGAAKAATDAIKITVDVQQHKAAIDATTGVNQHAILSAAGASAPVDPALLSALHDALCMREAYRAESDCAALHAAGGSVGAAEADPGSRPPGDRPDR